ncbi:metalloreductase STEAP3 [Osmerus eperlanus]|uniref:metalloreductase STEAP3 n=1 Tax=Osmerus eperlanus TaxID=29151 RepID=UPI002E150A73
MMPKEEIRKPLLRATQHPDASMSDPGSPVVGILGTGDFSRSLARRLVTSGFPVVVGSRNPKRCSSLFPEDVEVTSQHQAASQADLVFVAIHPEHYSTLGSLREALAGKAVVDVSNSTCLNRDGPSQAEQLAAMFPECSVVKGFNVISAWTLQTGPRDGSRQVLICGDSSQAKNSVFHICRSTGFHPVDMGTLSAARDIENTPLLLFPSWCLPALATLLLFLFFYLYNFLRDILHPYLFAGKYVFYKLPVETVNVTFPCVALVLLALVYAPGVLAAFLQLSRGTKYRLFPAWLDVWLRSRKQLGLCSFLCATLHAVYSLCLPMRKSARYKLLNAAFKQVKAGQEDSWVEQEVWRMELYLSVGILALGLLSLLAATSLPTVANSLNWREFSFIQSRLGYAALVMATLHTLIYGWDRGLDPEQYRFYLPPPFLLVAVVPCGVLLARLGLALPCVARRLGRIRRGWEEKRHIRFTLPEDAGRSSMDDVSGV